MEKVTVIGAGLAGSEAAWQLAEMGVPVKLAEMRPAIGTPAHHTGYCAELVCSNSFRAAALTNAVGLLKEEMRRLGSVIMECADAHRVPAGGALAVDRNGYAAAVTKKIKSHPLIEFVNEEIREIPEEGIVIIATGPLTDGALAKSIEKFCGGEGLHFYDAAAPIVMKESLDMDIVYRMSRYNKGEAAYLNCPMNEEEYNAFYEALRTAETAEVHGFEEGNVFEGCMPVEVMAQRGKDTMRFGPMKPVGLPDPRTGKEPYAVVQLRQDNEEDTMYNIVGFQTHLKWGEQKRVFWHDSRTCWCGVCPLWRDASEYLYPFAQFIGSHHGDAGTEGTLLCRADDRRRRVCRIGGIGNRGSLFRFRAGGGEGAAGIPAGDGNWRALPLYFSFHRKRFPADECEFRIAASFA